jgi:glucarate dehydratase
MLDYDIEYAEDPTWGIEGMGLVRRDVPMPLATNMCVVNFDQIPLAVRTRCIDIILSDVHYWGGLASNKKLAGVCETFQIGLGMHSDRELGISTAAQLHLAAALPFMSYAPDSHYHHQSDDIITKPFQYKNGCFAVPEGPGLGVEIDRDKLAKYSKLHEKKVNRVSFWIPTGRTGCRCCRYGNSDTGTLRLQRQVEGPRGVHTLEWHPAAGNVDRRRTHRRIQPR